MNSNVITSLKNHCTQEAFEIEKTSTGHESETGTLEGTSL